MKTSVCDDLISFEWSFFFSCATHSKCMAKYLYQLYGTLFEVWWRKFRLIVKSIKITYLNSAKYFVWQKWGGSLSAQMILFYSCFLFECFVRWHYNRNVCVKLRINNFLYNVISLIYRWQKLLYFTVSYYTNLEKCQKTRSFFHLWYAPNETIQSWLPFTLSDDCSEKSEVR